MNSKNVKNMRTKEEWIENLKHNGVTVAASVIENGKKRKSSFFYAHASEDHKNDRELNILNFLKEGFINDIPPAMIDFNFLKDIFERRNSGKIFTLPYQWKNNKEEKEFLKNYLVKLNYLSISRGHGNYNVYENRWTFEPGFWENIEYCKEIIALNFYKINREIVKEFNKNNDQEKLNIFINSVDDSNYYVKLINLKYREFLPEEIILKYVRKWGLDGLTKKQKNSFVLVKEAVQNNHLNYKDIPEKWKTVEYLAELLNCKKVWEGHEFKSTRINFDDLPSNLFKHEEIVKACLSDGRNYHKLYMYRSPFCHDKEIKKLALKTLPSFRIIEDCVDDKEMVLMLLESMHRLSKNVNKVAFFEDTKRIPLKMFKDREVMKVYLNNPQLDHQYQFCENSIKALHCYSLDELKNFIELNSTVYQVLSDELKEKWSLIAPFYQYRLNNDYHLNDIPSDLLNEIQGKTKEEKIKYVENKIFQEHLTETLENKDYVPKIKI